MTTDLTIEVSFTSDWHIGAGAGRQGSVDRLVRRDPADALPYVPGKTLTGMYRDACEQVATGLDGGGTGSWTGLLGDLFGDEPAKPGATTTPRPPRPARLSIGSARLADDLRQHLRSTPALRAALTFIRPGVRIDPDTGQAAEDHLRMVEFVRGGTTLTANASLDETDRSADWSRAVRALLWAGARVLDRIGGMRRRGAGVCVVSVAEAGRSIDDPAGPGKYEEQLLATDLGWRADLDRHASSATPVGSVPPPESFERIALVIELKEPVLIPDQVAGNAVSSLDYIPGTYLVRHVCRGLAAILGRPVFPLLASGAVRVMNAYPEIAGGRGLPAPMSYRRLKAEESGDAAIVWNLAAELFPPNAQPRPIRAGFVGRASGQQRPRVVRSGFVETTHNTIHDQQQRPVEAEVGVFTYEAIQPGTAFRSELWIASSLAAELRAKRQDWTTALGGSARVGVAKKDEYGAVSITVAPTVSPESPTPTFGRLVAWLVSDLLLRDSRLRPTASPQDVKAVLEVALGVSGRLRLHRVFARARRTGGWQTTWGLPRPSCVGLQAGTVLVFGVDGELPEDLPSRLRAIEASGLGERRGEGFGEVVFDHPLAALGVSTLDTAQSDTRRAAMAPRQITSTSRSHALGRVLESVAWRTAVRQSVVQWAADPRHREPPTGAASLISLGWKRREPTNTQLGALRALALGFPATRGVLATWIQKQLDRKDRWPAESLDVIRQMTTDAGFLWNAVGIDVSDLPAITEGARDSLPRDVWPEAVRALLLSAIRFETRAREASSRAVKGQAVEEAQ